MANVDYRDSHLGFRFCLGIVDLQSALLAAMAESKYETKAVICG